jgi:ferredoxin
MKTEANELLTFHLTGERPEDAKNDPATLELCPALLSGYRDLTRIRHDYPLVLVEGQPDQPVKSLSGIINAALQAVAPRGIAGERMRKNLISLEGEIRALASREGPRSLFELWGKAADSLLSRNGLSAEEREALKENLGKARSALGRDGQLLGCDENTPAAVTAHAWKAIRAGRDQSVKKEMREILIKLSDILKNDYMRSNEARKPQALKETVGTSFEDEFDFQAMSKALPKVGARDLLPKKRRNRIELALSVLESQKFFGSEQAEGAYSFEARSCTEALSLFRTRLPEMVDFVKALRVAGLEIENAYREEKHDKFFRQFNEDSLSADDIWAFPSYLVCLNDEDYDDANKAALIEILSSQLPMKVLFQTGEVFENSSVTNGGGAVSGWNLGLANMAMSLGSAFVLQTTGSNLYQVSESMVQGLTCQGPALFSVFSGSDAKISNLPPYLVSASATQSRAFPTLLYSPRNGDDWASRFSVDANPQPERIWPVNEFLYQDEDIQRITEEVAFTLVDYLATDSRFANGFMSVPRSEWSQEMIPLGEYLRGDEAQNQGKVPYILMVDQDNVLHRVVVTRGVAQAAKRYEGSWRNLQELGGIDNSHALRLLEREKQIWEEEKQKELDELRSQLKEEGAIEAGAAPAVGEAVAEAEAEAAVEEISPDIAYIETVRCSTCNECTDRNPKMFMYNDNKQAYIADLEAGTYRQMVEAAEVCKLAIIHPGKPWNPNEKGLEELMKRAEPFM